MRVVTTADKRRVPLISRNFLGSFNRARFAALQGVSPTLVPLRWVFPDQGRVLQVDAHDPSRGREQGTDAGGPALSNHKRASPGDVITNPPASTHEPFNANVGEWRSSRCVGFAATQRGLAVGRGCGKADGKIIRQRA